jgi:hypothetical protein
VAGTGCSSPTRGLAQEAPRTSSEVPAPIEPPSAGRFSFPTPSSCERWPPRGWVGSVRPCWGMSMVMVTVVLRGPSGSNVIWERTSMGPSRITTPNADCVGTPRPPWSPLDRECVRQTSRAPWDPGTHAATTPSESAGKWYPSLSLNSRDPFSTMLRTVASSGADISLRIDPRSPAVSEAYAQYASKSR